MSETQRGQGGGGDNDNDVFADDNAEAREPSQPANGSPAPSSSPGGGEAVAATAPASSSTGLPTMAPGAGKRTGSSSAHGLPSPDPPPEVDNDGVDGSGSVTMRAATEPERRENWDGTMLTRDEFVARFGPTDGPGLFSAARSEVGYSVRRASTAIRRLPTPVAMDFAEFLRQYETTPGVSEAQRAVIRQCLKPLEAQRKLSSEPPGFGGVVNRHLDNYIEGRKMLTEERRERAKQSKFTHALHGLLTNWKVELTLTLLLILDITFVIISINLEIAHLDSEVSDCEKFAEKAYEQCFEADANCVAAAGHGGRMARSTVFNCSCTPVPHFGDEELAEAEDGVRWTSVAILAVFVLDGLLHMLEMGSRFFTESHGMHLVDLTVVALALTFEVHAFEAWSNAFVFLIIGRLWRFVQFWHSIKHAENQPVVDVTLHMLEQCPEILAGAGADSGGGGDAGKAAAAGGTSDGCLVVRVTSL